MIDLRRSHSLSVVPLLLLVAGCVAHGQTRTVSPAPQTSTPVTRPRVSIQSPAPGEVVQGVAIIRFRTENVSITSLFLPTEHRVGSSPAAHLHVTVDGAAWHWVHSTSDPVVITPLSPGEHTVTLELAGADHHPLDARSVRFTVVAKATPAADHTGHP
jgi:hypothetical protein